MSLKFNYNPNGTLKEYTVINEEYERGQALERRLSALEKRMDDAYLVLAKLTDAVVATVETLRGKDDAPTDPAA